MEVLKELNLMGLLQVKQAKHRIRHQGRLSATSQVSSCWRDALWTCFFALFSHDFPYTMTSNEHIYMSGWWFQPLWKIWKSVGMLTPNIWKNKKWSKPPSHCPLFIYNPTYSNTTTFHLSQRPWEEIPGVAPLCHGQRPCFGGWLWSSYHGFGLLTMDRLVD